MLGMITIQLDKKNYHIDCISGRALRELELVAKIYARIVSILFPREESGVIDPCTHIEAVLQDIRWLLRLPHCK